MTSIFSVILLLIYFTNLHSEEPQKTETYSYDDSINCFLSEIKNKNSIESYKINEIPLYEDIIESNSVYNNFFGSAKIMILNKITTKSTIIEINNNKISSLDTMHIIFYGCWPNKNKQEGSAALFKIFTEEDDSVINIFSGWMFADLYFLNNINNDIYDIRLISCG